MEAKGLPSLEELQLLEPLKDQLPAEVFTTEYTNPVSNNATERRKNLREASKLLAEAGWNVTQDGNKSVLKNAKDEKLEVEFLLDSPLLSVSPCLTSSNWNCWALVSKSRQSTRPSMNARRRL
jgi:microcin C transport system substrate-binding protein